MRNGEGAGRSRRNILRVKNVSVHVRMCGGTLGAAYADGRVKAKG